ncbi:MAG: 2-amino-4-hydroxy-6-hydroxymethyldihydropteridine diphosphokinase [Terracidiphilus sp.]|nr:2-amino-4-hydroxy-6-hydroxymethyldihydropteridine diphosphokinase [Terracidiphilus sp.]
MTIAYIGMGGNLESEAGKPEATLAAALERLRKLGRVVARSRLYSTAPVGYADQPRFVNAVVGLEVKLGPRALLEKLMQIELEFGRERMEGFRNGPRTLDLDILLYGDFVLEESELVIPHPRLRERGFVLAPLAEIAPEFREPRSGRTIAQLLNEWRGGGTGEDEPIALESAGKAG